MKLARIRKSGATLPVVIESPNRAYDCSSLFPDWNSAFYAAGGASALAAKLPSLPIIDFQESDVLSCVPRPGKIVCIGLNYSDHAKEANMPIPTEPVIFMKAATAHNGPFDPIKMPRRSKGIDWEIELGIVIGKRSRYLENHEAALSSILGYTIVNDVSERHDQLERGGQWTKGKSHDTFCPVGPWTVTPDEVADPQNLAMKLTVNGIVRQNGNTCTMIFPVVELVRYVSQFMTLEPGDLLITGTPPGVGMGMKPPLMMQVGDTVELSISQLGTQRQTVIADEQ